VTRQADGHQHQWIETQENIVSTSVIGAAWSKCECGARLSVKDDQECVWEPMTVVGIPMLTTRRQREDEVASEGTTRNEGTSNS